MKIPGLFLASLLAALPAAAEPAARAISVDEAFALALVRSEAFAKSGTGVKELEAAERQYSAALKPGISGLAAQTLADGAPGKAQAAVNMNYRLFSGMRGYIAARAAGLRTEAARLDHARARQNLYLDVAAACITLYALRRQLDVRRAQLEVAAGRVKELEDRARIGRSRQGEVLAAKAQLAQNEASLQAALSGEDSAQLILAFLTGLEDEVSPQTLPGPPLPDPGPYLAAVSSRYDVAAARRVLEAAKLDADAQGRLALPSLDLDANYYLKRPAPAGNGRWDAGLTLKLPLYTGGYNAAAAAQAGARASSARLSLTLAERSAATEVKQAYSSLRHSLTMVSSLERALTLAAENADMQAKDYTYGLVTNLDVLNAQNAVLQTSLDLEQARAGAALAGARLETAAGRGGAIE